MGLFGRKDDEPRIQARALVVPASAGNLGDNVNELTADGSARTVMLLVVVWTADGLPGPPGQQRHVEHVPNWIRVVVEYAGTSDGPWAHLPPEVRLPVHLGSATRRVRGIDLDQAALELAPFRDVAVDHWRDTEGPMSAVRSAFKLPGELLRGSKALLADWRGSIDELRDGIRNERAGGPPRGPAWNEREVEAARRTANALRFAHERNPEQWNIARSAALQAGPSMADLVRAGTTHPLDFEHWLMFQETSAALTPDEAAALRRRAATAGDASN